MKRGFFRGASAVVDTFDMFEQKDKTGVSAASFLDGCLGRSKASCSTVPPQQTLEPARVPLNRSRVSTRMKWGSGNYFGTVLI